MKRLVTTLLTLSILALSTAAAHASVKEMQKSNVMFYEFGPSFIEGILNGPADELQSAWQGKVRPLIKPQALLYSRPARNQIAPFITSPRRLVCFYIGIAYLAAQLPMR